MFILRFYQKSYRTLKSYKVCKILYLNYIKIHCIITALWMNYFYLYSGDISIAEGDGFSIQIFITKNWILKIINGCKRNFLQVNFVSIISIFFK